MCACKIHLSYRIDGLLCIALIAGVSCYSCARGSANSDIYIRKIGLDQISNKIQITHATQDESELYYKYMRIVEKNKKGDFQDSSFKNEISLMSDCENRSILRPVHTYIIGGMVASKGHQEISSICKNIQNLLQANQTVEIRLLASERLVDKKAAEFYFNWARDRYSDAFNDGDILHVCGRLTVYELAALTIWIESNVRSGIIDKSCAIINTQG